VKIEFLETIKVVDGKVFNLEYHQERYERTLRAYGVNNFILLEDFLMPPLRGFYRCRVVYNLEGSINQEYFLYNKREIHSLKLIASDQILYDKKYLNRDMLNELFRQKGDADDIIIVKDGLITDTTIANIAFYDGECWVTPKKPLLLGTTRQRLLKNAFLKEVDINIDTLQHYSQLALMNAMINFDIITDKKIEEIIC
jgi:4-amino-4-deoxychorismate lyase